MRNSFGLKIATFFFILGILSIFFPYNILNELSIGTYKINIDKYSDLGSFVAGVSGPLLTCASFILLFITYTTQANELRQTQVLVQLQQLEGKYFELLKAHRENAQQIEKNGVLGRKVFVKIKDEFEVIFNEVQYISTLSSLNLTEIDICNVSFSILYFGIGTNSSTILKQYLHKFDTNTVNTILSYFEAKNINDGHQSRLGHYFNHLFYTIKFIDEQPFLNDNQKNEYVTLLKAQLSTHELSLLAMHNVSLTGTQWKSCQYINKFNFIGAIPLGFMPYLHIKRIYPNIKFDWENIV